MLMVLCGRSRENITKGTTSATFSFQCGLHQSDRDLPLALQKEDRLTCGVLIKAAGMTLSKNIGQRSGRESPRRCAVLFSLFPAERLPAHLHLSHQRLPREIVSFASRSEDEFVRLVMDNDLRQRDRNIAKRKRQLADSEKRITELDAIFKRLYEDSISGKLSDERFQKLSADYEKEEQELKVLASSLRKEVELEESKSADVDRFLSVVERCTDIPELTPCILHEFVEKIIVHAAAT